MPSDVFPAFTEGNEKDYKKLMVDENGRQLVNIGSLVTEKFDYLVLTYVSAGNGAGEIETVTYKNGGASGTTVAVLTLTYNANDNVATITRTDS